MSLTDSQGLAVGTDDPAVVAGIDTFVQSFLSYGTTAAAIWEAAKRDPACVMANVLGAALEMFMQTGESARKAEAYLRAAEPHAAAASPRERLWLEAVRAWAANDIPRAIAAGREIVRIAPRDIAAMKLTQVHMFHLGDAPAMLEIAEAALPANAEIPYMHGMHAFALEECHRLAEAEAAGRKAVAMLRREPWAHHAVAHVMEAQGRVAEGRRWMEGHADTWADCNSFMLTHNWWHAALFALDDDAPERALELYDTRVWGVWKEYSQDQVNAVALLARLEFAGIDVGARWTDVANYLTHRLHEHVEPFLDLHYLLGLARDGREASVAEMLTSMAEFGRGLRGIQADTWQAVAMPLARGIAAYGREAWAEAFDLMRPALPRLAEIGGSHAQRDLFHWLWLEAGYRAGLLDDIRPVLAERVAARPGVARHRRELARTGA